MPAASTKTTFVLLGLQEHCCCPSVQVTTCSSVSDNVQQDWCTFYESRNMTKCSATSPSHTLHPREAMHPDSSASVHPQRQPNLGCKGT